MVKNMTLRLSILGIKIVYNLFTNKDGITIKNLADNIKTDYKNTYNAVEELFKVGIIKKEKIGNYNICRLNYSNENTVQYLKEYNFYFRLNEFKRKHPTEHRIITETCGKLKEEMEPFFIGLIFGSFAKNEEKRESDVDLLFLTSFSKAETIINKILNKINAPYKRKFHITEQSIIDFIKDLKNKNKLIYINIKFF